MFLSTPQELPKPKPLSSGLFVMRTLTRLPFQKIHKGNYMAHLVETMMSVKETPWHGLGTILEEAPTAENAIVAAGLNWSVSKQQAQFVDSNGIVKPIEGQFAIVRDTDQKCVGHAGKTYQPLQNVDAFKFFDPFVLSGEASYETAGSLQDGQRIWILAKINRDPIEVVKGDVVNKYILLTNKHTGGFAVTGGLTPIRVVCNNTLTWALNSGGKKLFNATHSSRMPQRLEDIQATISQLDKRFQEAAEYYKRFAKKQVNAQLIDQFLAITYNWSVSADEIERSQRKESFQQKQTETILRLFETGRGADIKGVKGTVWGLYNAVTEHVAHERGKLRDDRLNSTWFGTGMNINKKAFEAAMAVSA